MEKIIRSVHQALCVDFDIGNVDPAHRDSLESFLDRNVVHQFPKDCVDLVTCGNPTCKTIHSVRYYFVFDNVSNVDVDAMREQLDNVLASWVMSMQIQV